MRNYLHPQMEDVAITRMSSLALAHVGDAVYELLVRSFLAQGGTQTARTLHARTTQLVCAFAQAKAAECIMPMLNEEEQDIFRHGRNAKPKTIPKSSTLTDYAYATALETLFGWLYLKKREDRINELFHQIASNF